MSVAFTNVTISNGLLYWWCFTGVLMFDSKEFPFAPTIPSTDWCRDCLEVSKLHWKEVNKWFGLYLACKAFTRYDWQNWINCMCHSFSFKYCTMLLKKQNNRQFQVDIHIILSINVTQVQLILCEWKLIYVFTSISIFYTFLLSILQMHIPKNEHIVSRVINTIFFLIFILLWTEVLPSIRTLL